MSVSRKDVGEKKGVSRMEVGELFKGVSRKEVGGPLASVMEMPTDLRHKIPCFFL